MSGEQYQGQKQSGQVSHKAYIIERAKRLDTLFKELGTSDTLCGQFFADPQRVGAQYGLTFSDEEMFGIQAMRGVELANLKERLTINPVAFFDANCSCSVLGSIVSRPAR